MSIDFHQAFSANLHYSQAIDMSYFRNKDKCLFFRLESQIPSSAGTMEVGIEATCQRAAVLKALGETGVITQPVQLPLKFDFLDVLQVQRK